MRRLLSLTLGLASMGALLRCSFDELALEGRPCPCAAPLVCDQTTGRCSKEPTVILDASADAGGDSGMDAGTDADAASCAVGPRRRTIVSTHSSACAIKGGRLYCWGSTDNGLVGDGSGLPQTVPVAIDPDGVTTGFIHLSAIRDTVCALHEDARLWCWGVSANGQAGELTDAVETPNLITTSESYVDVASGQSMTLALKDSGELLAWGTRNGGCLGDNNAFGPPTPDPVLANSTEKYVRVVAGSGAGCGITAQGATHCWGHNSCKQFSDGPGALVPSPALVDCLVDVGLGHKHACYIDEEGRLFCAGTNESGALGIGSLGTGEEVVDAMGTVTCDDAFIEPQPVLPAQRFAAVAAGFIATCAITVDGALYCFGKNDNGNVGPDGVNPVITPTQVNPEIKWAEVSVGQRQTCARPVGSEAVYCMGDSPVVDSRGTLSEVPFP